MLLNKFHLVKMSSTKTVRNIREPLKKPRPLKSTSSSDQLKFLVQDPKETVIQKSRADILSDLEILNVSISNCNFDEVTAADISRMCAILKKRGEELDSMHKDALDRYFCTLRNASREDRLDVISRLKLLEVIEMRARHWKMNENLTNYFNMKTQELEQGLEKLNISGTTSPSIPYSPQNQHAIAGTGIPLAPGEILRSSGKFAKPTKIAGKNYFKDEIVIRNSDSGKVNPGARDRLVQITGPHEEAIGHAKLLVEDTIRRNASPVRENIESTEMDVDNREYLDYGTLYSGVDNQPKKQLVHSYSMGDASRKEYSFPVYIGQDIITLSGTKSELLKTAKLVLTEYFAGQTELMEKHHDSLSSSRLQSTPQSNTQRFDLKRQSSLKDNMPNSLPSSWMDPRRSNESVSPFSSDDDFVKEDKSTGIERMKIMKDLPISVAGEVKDRTQSLENAEIHDKFMRSFSAPEDYSSFENFDISSPSNKENMLVSLLPSTNDVPIPPPSYKKQPYSREFLLNCAKSPLSHTQPANFAHIYQNFKEIICQTPVMFDPSEYFEKERNLEESYSTK